ncbi:MAG: hypothetical protein ACRDSR_28315 [Pseudonocardiaceae bacterium]
MTGANELALPSPPAVTPSRGTMTVMVIDDDTNATHPSMIAPSGRAGSYQHLQKPTQDRAPRAQEGGPV